MENSSSNSRNLLSRFVSGAFGQLQHGANVFLDREAAEDRALLRQISDAQPGPPIHGQMGDIRAIEADRPLSAAIRPVIM